MHNLQAETSDGLEIISIGAIYKGTWDKKYWSSSRGKDRYPYPIGYHAVRMHNGITYKMEICEGLKGPSFLITSTSGESFSGQTPDIAWESFQKKSAPRAKLGNGKRFSCKIDGVEFFGFRNPFVQRMLRELVSNVSATAERNLLSSSSCNKACTLECDTQYSKSFKHPDLLPPATKHRSTGKRSRKDKIATTKAANSSELKKLQKQDVSKAANGKNCINSSTLHEDFRIAEKPDYLPSAVEIDKVVERGSKSFSAEDGSAFESQMLPNVLEKDYDVLQDQNPVGSKDSKFTSPVTELPKQEEQNDTLLGGETIGRNFPETTKDVEETMSLSMVANLDLCAPDSLDLLQDSVSDLAPECNMVSPHQVKDESDASGLVLPVEEVRSLPGEDQVCTDSSNQNSEKNSDDSVGQDLANSMITLLLPQALPLLKRTYGRKRAKVQDSERSYISRDACLKFAAKKSSEENHGELEVAMLVKESPKDKQEQMHCSGITSQLDSQRSENLKSVVPDSFEDEQCGNDPNYQSSLCSGFVKAGETLYDNKDCGPDRSLESSFAQERSSNPNVRICGISENFSHEVPLLYTDNLKLDGLMRSGSHIRFTQTNRQICLKGKSENLCVDSDENSLHHELCSRLDKTTTTASGPVKDIPSVELTSVTDCATQAFQGESIANFVKDSLSLADELPNKEAACSAEIVALTSDMVVKEVLPPKSAKHIENITTGSSKDEVAQCWQKHHSTAKRFHDSNDHENQYNNAGNQISAPKDAKDVNSVVSVILDHKPEKEVDFIETSEAINKNLSSNQISGLRKTRKFRGPFSESIICRNTGEGVTPEVQTLFDTDIGQVGDSSENLHRKVSSGAEVKFHGEDKHFSTEIGDIRSNVRVSQAQALVDHVVKGKDVTVGKKHQDAIVDGTASSLLFQERAKNLLFDGNGHDTKDHLHNLNAHPQFKASTSSAQDCGTLLTCSELEECLSTDQYLSLDTKLNRASEDVIELVGCYMQPAPILSVVLNAQGDDIHISIICGVLGDRLRTIFIYRVPLKEPRRGYPSFLGYTSIMLPISKYTFAGEDALERLLLQFTPDGQSLIFANSFKAPYCREQSIHCLCPVCTTNCSKENAVKIIRVKLGYLSLVVKLKTEDTIHSILVCEPSYLVALEKNGRLQGWIMNSLWSEKVEEFILPSLDHMAPCIVELKKNPKHPFLIIGHNGVGDFGLWDISKRVVVSRFSAPRNCISQFLPVGAFRWKRGPARGSCNLEQQIKGVMAATRRMFSGNSEEIDCCFQEDIAVWLLVSAICDSEVEYDHRANGFNTSADGSWRLALLVDNMVILGSMLDPRASVVDALEGCGVIGTEHGLVYIWELSTGVKLADLHTFKSGNVSCISVDSKSGVLAVAGDGNQLMVYEMRRSLRTPTNEL